MAYSFIMFFGLILVLYSIVTMNWLSSCLQNVFRLGMRLTLPSRIYSLFSLSSGRINNGMMFEYTYLLIVVNNKNIC